MLNPDEAMAAANGQQPSAPSVEVATRCTLPPYWKFDPRLWFAKVEAAFNVNRIRSDASKFDLVVAHLDPEIAQEVSDVILNPPSENRYEQLKLAIMSRLTDSADRQLHRLFSELQLGDRKPSQLLRQMKSLAGAAITDEAMRVKWFDLLPPNVSRLLKVLKATSLDELATLADELVPGDAMVAAVSVPSPRPSTTMNNPTPTSSLDPVAQELAELRLAVVQLTALTRQLHATQVTSRSHQRSARGRSRSRSRPGGPAGRSPSPAANTKWCWYHRTHGEQATNCRPPCAFPGSGN